MRSIFGRPGPRRCAPGLARRNCDAFTAEVGLFAFKGAFQRLFLHIWNSEARAVPARVLPREADEREHLQNRRSSAGVLWLRGSRGNQRGSGGKIRVGADVESAQAWWPCDHGKACREISWCKKDMVRSYEKRDAHAWADASWEIAGSHGRIKRLPPCCQSIRPGGAFMVDIAHLSLSARRGGRDTLIARALTTDDELPAASVFRS